MTIKWMHDIGMTWLGRARLRAIVYVIGIPLAAFGVITLSPAWLTLPVVGVALAAVTMTVNKTANRLVGERCWTCGTSLKGEPAAVQGIVCPGCGALNQYNPARLAAGEPTEGSFDFSGELDDDAPSDSASA